MRKLKEYTKDDIETFLSNADATKLDPNELDIVLDLLTVQTIDMKTGNNKFSPKFSAFAMEYLDEFTKAITSKWDEAREKDEPELTYETTEAYFDKVNAHIKLSSTVFKIDDEQGITVGDYDRNIWRATYVLKSIQMAELQKAQGLPVEQKEHLLENQDKENLEGFADTTQRILNTYIKTMAVINLLKFLGDYTGIKDFARLQDRFMLDLGLRNILADEAERVESLILDPIREKYTNVPKSDETENQFVKELDDLIMKYKPFITVPQLKDIKLPPKTYAKIRDKYINLPLQDIISRYKDIQLDFHGEILRGYYEQ